MSVIPKNKPLLLACALMILTATSAGLAAPESGGDGRPGRQGARHEEILRRQAEAISRLSDQQRRAYFAELEQLVQERSRNRLEQISRLRSCMDQARGATAVESCQRAFQQNRRQQMQQGRASMTALRQRFGLPVPERGRGPRQRPLGGTQGV